MNNQSQFFPSGNTSWGWGGCQSQGGSAQSGLKYICKAVSFLWNTNVWEWREFGSVNSTKWMSSFDVTCKELGRLRDELERQKAVHQVYHIFWTFILWYTGNVNISKFLKFIMNIKWPLWNFPQGDHQQPSKEASTCAIMWSQKFQVIKKYNMTHTQTTNAFFLPDK